MGFHILVLAGGSGTRLWPLSRRSTPKHLLPLAPGGETLLRATLERVIGLGDSVRVVTAAAQADGCRAALAGLGLPEDAVIVEGEWGWVEEITSTYVVVRLWDWRRMILPIAYFLEKPFQNWTRESASLIGSVYLYLDYSVPVEAVRTKLSEIAAESKLCDGKVINLQMSDARERVVELRALVSARTAPQCWDLRCEVREKMIAWLQREYPGALPRRRAEVELPGRAA